MDIAHNIGNDPAGDSEGTAYKGSGDNVSVAIECQATGQDLRDRPAAGHWNCSPQVSRVWNCSSASVSPKCWSSIFHSEILAAVAVVNRLERVTMCP